MEVVKTLVLLTVLLLSVIIDIKYRKIPNYITLSAIGVGMVINLMSYRLKDGIEGMLVAFGIFIIPYILGIVGGGDVKLLMAIGAIKGLNFAIYSSVCTILCGGIIAFGILIKKKVKLSDFLEKLAVFVFQKKTEESKNYFPYSIAIFSGVLISLLVEYFGIGYEK